jgi:transcriptional regulator with XRE-family HTH domain
MPKKTTTDALKILVHMSGKDPTMQRGFEEEVANREVAQKIFQLRHDSGLSQTELARRVGTTQSVISRLEDADYAGHSLAMLNRIAAAVERRVEIRFVPRKRRLHAGAAASARDFRQKATSWGTTFRRRSRSAANAKHT